MNLNIDKSLGDYFYGNVSEQAEKEIIMKYIDSFVNTECIEKNIPKICNVAELSYLTSIGRNIISWYPFRKNSEVLLIGGELGNIAECLCEKKLKVTCVEPVLYRANAIGKRCSRFDNLNIFCSLLDNINFDKKFDYILCINNLEFYNELFKKNIEINEFFEFMANLLNDDGRLLFSFNNSVSLKRVFNFTTNKSLNDNNTFSIKKIYSILDNIRLNSRHIYYPLPDSILPNVIFSDYMLPNNSSIDKFVSYYDNGSIETFNEVDAYKSLINIDKELFKKFANSFLIDAGKNEIQQKYFYISFNNIRKEKYRLVTKISKENVEKEPITKESINHILEMAENVKLLKEKGINIFDEYKNKKIISGYVKQDYMLIAVLLKQLKNGNIKSFYDIFDKFINLIKNMKSYNEIPHENIFKKYGINISKEILEELNFVEYGFWDMTITNCFYIDDKFYFFDQEWKDENVPIEYMIFKNIYYNNLFEKYITKAELYSHFNIEKYIQVFIQLDEKIQYKIRDDKIWEFYTKDFHKNVCNLIDDYNRQNDDFINYRKLTSDLITAKDNEIKNCNIRLENSQKRIEEQDEVIKVLSESFKVKVTRFMSRILKGEKKDEKKD